MTLTDVFAIIDYNNRYAIPEHELEEVLNPSNDSSQELIHKKCVINQLDKEVREEYTRFMSDLLKLFNRQGVSVDDAIFAFSNLYDETALTSDIQEATNVRSFFLALKKNVHQSWYNFGTTASLAGLLGGDEGKGLVKSYETKVKVHLAERVKVSVPGIRTRRIEIKVDEKRERFTEEKVIEFRNTAARLLDLKQKELVLRYIRDGCVQFTYLFPAALAPSIRSAIGTCSSDLREHRVISVSIDG